MIYELAQATQYVIAPQTPWTPEAVTALVSAIVTGITGIIIALKALFDAKTAKVQSSLNSDRVNNVSQQANTLTAAHNSTAAAVTQIRAEMPPTSSDGSK